METFGTVTLLMAGAVGLAFAARWLRLPYAVALVLAGMALAVTPGVPALRLDPKLAMAFFLPPLLQASAFFTPLRAFARNLRPILMLALGLVGFTTVLVGWTTKQFFPELPWAVCFAFGALIAPPDAAAATAVMSAVAVPRRVVTILEGESLLNDASGLVLYNFAVAAVATGAFSAWGAASSFGFLAAGGLLIGWATGRLASFLSARLNDPVLEITVSFLAAFGSFAGAEVVHASGVLATVMCGLTVAWHAPEWMSPRTRVDAKAVWDFAVFVLNSLVFTLIGLELRGIIQQGDGAIEWRVVGHGLVLALVLIVSRFVWVFPMAYGYRFLLPHVRAKDPYPSWRAVTVVSWAGMRGVVSLAAALGIPNDVPPAEADAKLRRRLADAAVDHLSALHEDPMVGPFARDLTPFYAAQAAGERLREVSPAAAATERATLLTLRLEALAAQRALLLRLYRAREVDDHAVRMLETELDLEELRLSQLREGHAA
jgi:CPA1 family monovalent cation:H+ antiporter